MTKQTPKPVSQGKLTRCKKCDSTEREKYFGTPTVFDISGLDEDNKPYNRKVMRRTKCKNCGQQRLDSFFELRKK